MSDQYNFALPEKASPPPRGGRGVFLALALVMVAQVAVLALLLRPRGETGASPADATRLDLDAQRELALKLEKQGLTESAVQAWQAYLTHKGDDRTKAAEIWYRIGTLWQDAGRYEPALAAYYTSESYARLPNLESEVGRRVQECLDALGKYAALRYELKDRTTVGGAAAAGDEVVAEIGPRKITKADLDRLIEDLVAGQLERFARGLSPEPREQRRNELLKQFGDNAVRRQVLGQYLATEVLYRKAREDRLTDQAEIRAQLQEAERSILASSVVDREVAGKVHVTPGDVQTYYEANKEQFREPERARVAHIQVADEEKAKALLASLGEGQSFEELARTVSQDAASAARQGALEGMVVAGRDEAPGVGPITGLSEGVFGTAAGAVVPRPLRSAKGWHIVRVNERLPATLPPLEHVAEEAQRRLQESKEREVQDALIRDLFRTYDVVLHHQALGGGETPPAGALPAVPPAGAPTP